MARLVENWLHTTEKMGIIVLKLGNCRTLSVGHFPWLVGDPAILFSRIGVFRVRYRTLCNCSLISASLSISLKSFSMPVFSWWFVEVSPIARIFSSTQMICFFCHVGGKLVVNLKHQGSLLFLEAVWRCFSFSWNIEIREKVIGRQGLLSLVDFSSFLQLLLFNQKLWPVWLFFFFYICGCKFF